MAKRKPPTRRQRLRNRIAQTPADSVQASIRGDIAQLRRMALAQSPMPLGGIPKWAALNPDKFGATGADIQYGEAIRELQRAIRGQEAQAPVNLQRTAELFQGAQRSFETAKANNQRSADAAIAEQAAADAAIAASMGGEASEAAAALAQSGSANQGFLRGLKTSNEAFDARNVAIAGEQGAKAQTMQASTDAARLAELQGDLGDRQVQRGLAATELAQQARDTNWQRRMAQMEAEMGVRQFNRQGREARFAQLSSLPALKLSAMMAGTQMTGAEADILNALDAPIEAAKNRAAAGRGGSGTPRLANGMTPSQWASHLRQVQKNQQAQGEVVRKRRAEYSDALMPGLVGQDEEGQRVDRVRNSEEGVTRAIRLARSRGLDIKQPGTQAVMLDTLMDAMPGWDENKVRLLLAKRSGLIKTKYGSTKVKPKNRRRSGR